MKAQRMKSRSHFKGMLVILATLSLVSLTYACKFWGFYDFDPPISTNFVSTHALHMCSLSNTDDDGWSVLSYTYGSSPSDVFVFRSDDDIQDDACATSCDYDDQIRLAADADKTLYLGHARKNDPRFGQDLIDDPHPFIYERNDDFVALAHNGGFDDVCDLQDAIGAGFAALNRFVKRPYTTWYDDDDPCYDPGDPTTPAETIVDTEYYAILFMRQLLIAENYYIDWDDPWEAVGINDVSYAINSSAEIIDGAGIDYTSLNAEVATQDGLWAIYKRHSSDSYSHDLSVRQGTVYPDNTYREVITESNTGGDWTNFVGLGENFARYILLEPDVVNTPVSIDNTMTADELHPTELQVNGRDDSEGNQSYPAIAADPTSGTFAVVWDDNESNHIKLRWYNQMGLAESPEIEVNNTTCLDVKDPAVAISPESGKVFVVWAEKEIGTNYYTIQYRTFDWDPDDYEWTGSLTGAIMTGVGEDGSHPAIAVREDDTFAIVWRKVSAFGIPTINYAAFSPSGNVVDQIISGSSLIYENGEPDITALKEGSNNSYAVTWEFDNTTDLNGPKVQARIIKTDNGTLGSIQDVYQASARTSYTVLNPAIEYDVTTTDKFALGFYTGSNIRGCFATTDASGNISIAFFYAGEAVSSKGGPHIDVATRSNGQMEICYDKSVLNNIDIYIAESGIGFVNVERVNTTTANTQAWPAMAISQEYICTSDNGDDYYGDISVDSPFDERRIIVWHSYDQDGDSYGVVGNFTAIVSSGDDREPWWTEDVVSDAIGCCDELSKINNPGEPEASDVSRYKDSDILDDEATLSPTEFNLYAPSPNPFNPTTTLSFDVPEAIDVSLNVYDLNGRLISTLVSGYTPAGSHQITFDGSNLSTGTYFVRMNAGSFVSTQKLLLVK